MKIQESSVTVACFIPGRAKDLSAAVYYQKLHFKYLCNLASY